MFGVPYKNRASRRPRSELQHPKDGLLQRARALVLVPKRYLRLVWFQSAPLRQPPQFNRIPSIIPSMSCRQIIVESWKTT